MNDDQSFKLPLNIGDCIIGNLNVSPPEALEECEVFCTVVALISAIMSSMLANAQ